MRCDICGKESELFKTEIEGSTLAVCSNCSSYGKVISKIVQEAPQTGPKKEAEQEEPLISYMIKPGYAKLIKQSREKKNIKQEDLAKQIAEKESVIQKIEAGKMQPPIGLARKLEKMFGIELVEEIQQQKSSFSKENSGEGMTLGDMIKIK